MHQFVAQPPESKDQLLQRAFQLSGMTLGQLANKLNQPTPETLLHAKGWVGQLLEKSLGATAGNLDLPDFPNLGIELKTLPINHQLLPQESTYLCRISLPINENDFYQSRVWRKCQRILWIPIQAAPAIPIVNRQIGTPLLWRPSAEIEAILKQDWHELNEMMRLGQFENLSARLGTYLHVRPKAANSKDLIHVLNEEGTTIPIVPKGFYLRSCLTQHILSTNFFLA